jgi:hypothetical protein
LVFGPGNEMVIHGNWSDIFRPPTCRVSQTIVFRYREIEGRLCTK